MQLLKRYVEKKNLRKRMTNNYSAEQWKTIHFDFEHVNNGYVEISNYGRVRSFNRISKGNILKPSVINGYYILRLKLYRPRDAKSQKEFDYLHQQAAILEEQLKALKSNSGEAEKIANLTELYNSLRKSITKRLEDDLKSRIINYSALIHRLVATYFLHKTSDEHSVVAHIDFEKQNNLFTNLKWMTLKENYEHQQKSPYVLKEKAGRLTRRKESSKATKLTVTKVMLLKKLLNEGKPLKTLVKQFKISETQIFRIKRGENWGDIEAAK